MSDEPEQFTVTDRRKITAGELGDVVDAARARHAIPLPADVEQAIARGEAAATALIRQAVGDADLLAEFDRTPFDPAMLPITYVAHCVTCSQANDTGLSPIPFGSAADRDGWAHAHARDRRHTVTLAEQGPQIGTRLVGTAEPPALPLIAFVVPEGGEPDLMCRVPERAGAAWLLHAAHACMLGRAGGSAGIPVPHRAMYVGRFTTSPATYLDVRVDGVVGAVDDRYGRPIGMRMQVDGSLTPAQAEDVVEDLIHRGTGLPRNLFSVILIADPGVGEPPDPEADELLRAARLADAGGALPAETPPPGALLGIPGDPPL